MDPFMMGHGELEQEPGSVHPVWNFSTTLGRHTITHCGQFIYSNLHTYIIQVWTAEENQDSQKKPAQLENHCT